MLNFSNPLKHLHLNVEKDAKNTLILTTPEQQGSIISLKSIFQQLVDYKDNN